uniref:Uncharacterized protein n=1 Tax=Lates calcarifer TaxID=8187 RepID=A0A4W6EJF9_LATCA
MFLFQTSENRRSLDLESFNMHVTPTASKISLPSIIRLYPPTAKPLHMHANMPMRFGRESHPGDDKVIRMCAECPDVHEARNPELPQRFGRNSLYWRLLRTLANEQLHWTEDFDFTTSSEEVEMEEKSFKR